jgi:hypothetical protein
VGTGPACPPAAAARRVTDSSGEGFAVRLYKAAVPAGVVRAFSDVPSSFASEFNKVGTQKGRGGGGGRGGQGNRTGTGRRSGQRH